MGDHKGLARLIIKYNRNPKQYNRKILLGYKSLNKFSFENNCKKYINEIKKII